MKKTILFSLLFLLAAVSFAQISVRVKKSASGGQVDVKTSGKSGGTEPAPNKKQGSGDEQGTVAGNSSSSPAPVRDTAARPTPNSQPDAAYNGPAKVQVKSLWRQLEKLRSGEYTVSHISNAEKMLKEIREKDPAYPMAALETEVAGYREKFNQDTKARQAGADRELEDQRYFTEVWQNLIGVYSKGSEIQPGVTGKVYYEKVQALKLEEYQQKKKEASSQPAAQRMISEIDDALADYEQYLERTDRMRWNVTEKMVKSRSQANPQEKMKLLEEARYECMAVLILAPGNAAFTGKLAEINKLLGAAGSEAAKLYTSDFHRENLGKIIWSSQPLVIGKETQMAGQIKSAFKAGEPVFGTVYLGNSVKELMNGNDRLRIIIKVDGGTAIWGGDLSYIIIPLQVQDKSYLQFALLPDEEWFRTQYAPYLQKENWTYSYLMDELVRAGDISHSITCELDFPSPIQSNIRGSLNLDLGAGIAPLKSLAVKLHDQMMATRTLPRAGMSSPALEQQMLQAANNLGWKNTFLKTIITSSSWSISKNELTGAILYRYLSAVCTTKDPDGKCYYQEFTFRQDYSGGGNYSSPVKFNSYGSKREIGCDKLK